MSIKAEVFMFILFTFRNQNNQSVLTISDWIIMGSHWNYDTQHNDIQQNGEVCDYLHWASYDVLRAILQSVIMMRAIVLSVNIQKRFYNFEWGLYYYTFHNQT